MEIVRVAGRDRLPGSSRAQDHVGVDYVRRAGCCEEASHGGGVDSMQSHNVCCRLANQACESGLMGWVAHGFTAEFVQADVTTLDPAQLGSGFDFFLDVGCFQGLSDPQRSTMGRSVTALAGPAATLLLLAFKAGAAPRPLPRGADTADLERAFPQRRIIDTEAAITDGMPKPLRRAAPTWYRLRYQP